MAYLTPRMLARTLLLLRERSQFTLEELGVEIGRSKSAISNYENREDNVTFEILHRYQLLFGVPNGVILAMSHVAALARDASTHPSAERRALEKQRLLLFGQYLRNLSDRILDRGDQAELSAYPGLDDGDENSWRELLEDIFESTRAGTSTSVGLGTVFTDREMLLSIIDGK